MKNSTLQRLVLFSALLGCASSVAATSAEDDEARMRAVAAEVAARRLVREHESGQRKATDAELAAARELIRKNSERHAREVTPATEEDAPRLRAIAAEVAARRLVYEQLSGKKRVSETELAAARELIRKAEERRARAVTAAPEGDFKIEIKDADMSVLTGILTGVFGFEFTVSDRLKEKKVSVSVADASLDLFREKLQNALRTAGVYFLSRPDGVILDSVPDKYGPR